MQQNKQTNKVNVILHGAVFFICIMLVPESHSYLNN